MRKLLPFFLVLLVALASAQSTDGSKSSMGAANLAKLRRLKMKFLVPTYLPAGYKFQSLEIEDAKDPVLLTMAIRYVNAKTKGELLIQMCSDGIGDVLFVLPNGDTVDPTGEMKWKSAAIGSGIIETCVKKNFHEWHLNWIEFKSKPTFLSVIGHNLSPTEGKKVIEGLRWLK